MYTRALSFIFFGLFISNSNAVESTSIAIKRATFVCYHELPVDAGNLSTVNVILYKDKPSTLLADKILRQCLDSALLIDRKKDILATAWYSPTGNDIDEVQIPIDKNGTSSLLYKSKTEKVEPFKPW